MSDDLTLARSLIQRGEYDAARRVLTPLVRTDETAARWLEQLNRRYAPTTPAASRKPARPGLRLALGALSLFSFIAAVVCILFALSSYSREFYFAAAMGILGIVFLLTAYFSRRFRPAA